MKIHDIKYQGAIDESIKVSVRELIESANSLDDILKGWRVEKGRSIDIFQGIDDDRPDFEIIGIRLQYKGTGSIDIGPVENSTGEKGTIEFYIAKEDLLDKTSHVRSLNEYMTGFDKSGHIILNNRALNQWESELGFAPSETLYHDVAPETALAPFVLSFMLSDGGEIHIERGILGGEEELEEYADDLKRENLCPEKLLCITAHYSSRKIRRYGYPGLSACKYILSAV